MVKILSGVICFLLLISACSQEKKEPNAGSANAVTTSVGEDEAKSIEGLEKVKIGEIGGLWKLYKTVWPSGSSMIEKENSFLEIKDDKKYSEDNRNGYYFLSFAKDSSGIATLFTQVVPYTNTDAKITVSRIEKTVDNGTTYLKLTALTNGEKSFYIKQQ